MYSKAYIQGFMDKLAAFAPLDRAALNSEYDKYVAEQQKDNDVPVRKPYRKPETFGGQLKYMGNRALTHLNSLGRGIGSAAAVAGLRAGHGAIDLATWLPSLADDILFGKLMGIDEGHGLTGRLRGKLGRNVDRAVHAVRKWSDDYDYANRVGGGFNRFLNGTVADVVGGVAGWGGIGSLLKRQWLGTAFAGLGGAGALWDGREKQLRSREEWLRSLNPRDRLGIDPTSTATNQMSAPTVNEYRRYHMPMLAGQTSPTGYIRIPYNWRHTMMNAPVQFREFGT